MQRRAVLHSLLVMLTAAPLATFIPAVAAASPDNRSLSLPGLTKPPVGGARAATNQFFEGLEAWRHEIVAQVKNPAVTGNVRVDLYRIAAELRVYQTMDTMINDIQFLDPPDSNSPTTAVRPFGVGGYTAQTALSTFGLPAFREIMEVMSDHKPDAPFVAANTNAYAWVLWAIEGKRGTVVRLQARLAKEQAPKVRSQYQMVIDRLKVFNNDDRRKSG